jgi:hypothetical protein
MPSPHIGPFPKAKEVFEFFAPEVVSEIKQSVAMDLLQEFQEFLAAKFA